MLPTVKLICSPSIHWDEWIGTVYQITNRSPTRILDQSKQLKFEHQAFLESLSSFVENDTFDKAVKQVPYILDMLHFNFLIYAERDYAVELNKRTTLKMIANHWSDDKSVLLLTGSLYDWRNAIISFSTKEMNFDLRYIFNAVFLLFDQLGIKIMFDRTKIELSDQTFIW